MIYVFTYHKVRANAAADQADFYTVAPEQLSRHLEMLDAEDFRLLKMEELLQNPAPPAKSYLLTFDDGTTDHYETVFPLLEKNHCQGIFFVPTSKLNKPGYLTNTQVQKLAGAGHVIGFHSHEHHRLDRSSAEEIRRQIALSQKIIADIIGVKPVVFSPPGGYINECIRNVALESGVRIIRTMRWGYNQRLDLAALEALPINHYTNEKKFLRILEVDDAHFLYTVKEAAKRLLPLRGYEKLRSLLFRFSKSD